MYIIVQNHHNHYPSLKINEALNELTTAIIIVELNIFYLKQKLNSIFYMKNILRIQIITKTRFKLLLYL